MMPTANGIFNLVRGGQLEEHHQNSRISDVHTAEKRFLLAHTAPSRPISNSSGSSIKAPPQAAAALLFLPHSYLMLACPFDRRAWLLRGVTLISKSHPKKLLNKWFYVHLKSVFCHIIRWFLRIRPTIYEPALTLFYMTFKRKKNAYL